MAQALVPQTLLDRPEGDVLLLLCGLLTLRTEAAYVLPWVAHHKLMGVDHVVLYHDDASGSWHPKLAIAHKELLAHLAGDEFVTLLSMREQNLSSQAQQIGHCANLTSEIAAGGEHASACLADAVAAAHLLPAELEGPGPPGAVAAEDLPPRELGYGVPPARRGLGIKTMQWE